MKKIISIIISLVFVLSMIAPMATNVSAADALMDWYDLQPEGSIVYTPNFNGDAGVYEPGYLSGDPVVTVDPVDSNSITMTSGTNKAASYWGGFIETLPLNEYTCYTIYFTVTRTTSSAIGIYCDSVWGMYGYPDRTKLMKKGSDMPGGHAYQYYATDKGYDVPVLVDGTECVQEFAMEVNGVDTTIGYFIKDVAGEWKQMDYANPGDIDFFNADVLGLFFYVYYNTQVSTVSNCYITKGLSFTEVTYPERTEAPETTPAPETTKAPETTPAETTAEATEAPENNEGDATQAPAPEATKAPEKTEEKKGGCGGFVAGGVALVALLGTAIIVKKRD
ncbi:MAG: hypothetical protein J6S71_10280 [Clostridia bacterium]|nr:hypothetical protein [Clostridia bacterium]